MSVIVSVLLVVFMFGALADIITIDATRMKHLPKIMWVILVILLPLVGSILWFTVGRQYVPRTVGGSYAGRRMSGAPTMSSSRRDLSVRDASAELAALEREIAAHEREERIRELEAQLEAKRREKGTKS